MESPKVRQLKRLAWLGASAQPPADEPGASLPAPRPPDQKTTGWLLSAILQTSDVQRFSPAWGLPAVSARLVRAAEAGNLVLELHDAATDQLIRRIATAELAALATQVTAYTRQSGRATLPAG